MITGYIVTVRLQRKREVKFKHRDVNPSITKIITNTVHDGTESGSRLLMATILKILDFNNSALAQTVLLKEARETPC